MRHNPLASGPPDVIHIHYSIAEDVWISIFSSDPLLLGSDGACDLRLPGRRVGRRHAEIFPEGSDFGETNALDAVWEKFDDFKQAAANAEKATAALVKAAESGDEGAIKARFGDVGKACKACHKEYKE